MNLMNRIESLESRVRFLSRLESGGGKVVSVQYAEFTATQASSVGAGGSVAISTLSITHAMAKSTNKLLLLATVGIVANSDSYAEVGVAFAVNGAMFPLGNSAGSRTRVTATGATGAGSAGAAQPRHISTVYTPGTTASKAYTVRAINVVGGTRTVYINRRQNDADAAYEPRGASTLTLIEYED
jgi:hypothetical protein